MLIHEGKKNSYNYFMYLTFMCHLVHDNIMLFLSFKKYEVLFSGKKNQENMSIFHFIKGKKEVILKSIFIYPCAICGPNIA